MATHRPHLGTLYYRSVYHHINMIPSSFNILTNFHGDYRLTSRTRMIVCKRLIRGNHNLVLMGIKVSFSSILTLRDATEPW